MSLSDLIIALKYGTSHSGDWGHRGRPGRVGGSGGGGGHAALGFSEKPDLRELRGAANAVTLMRKVSYASQTDVDELLEKYQFGGCTDAECQAVRAYTGGDYKDINGTLRRPDKAFGPYLENTLDTIAAMDTAFENAPTLDKSIRVTRGVNYAGKLKEILDSLEPGDEFQDKAFVSTTTQKTPGFGSFYMDIIVPKGSKALYVESISNYAGEQELILPRGAKFRLVTQRDPKTNRAVFEYIGSDPTNVEEEILSAVESGVG